jgi:hypothetical protein
LIVKIAVVDRILETLMCHSKLGPDLSPVEGCICNVILVVTWIRYAKSV